MPIYEYYCATCNVEYEAIRPASQADEPVPCKTCDRPGRAAAFNFLLQVQHLYGSEVEAGWPAQEVLLGRGAMNLPARAASLVSGSFPAPLLRCRKCTRIWNARR